MPKRQILILLFRVYIYIYIYSSKEASTPKTAEELFQNLLLLTTKKNENNAPLNAKLRLNTFLFET